MPHPGYRKSSRHLFSVGPISTAFLSRGCVLSTITYEWTPQSRGHAGAVGRSALRQPLRGHAVGGTSVCHEIRGDGTITISYTYF